MTRPRPLLRLALAFLGVAAGLACSDAPPPPSFEGPRPQGEIAERMLDALSLPDSIERVAAVAGLLSELGEDAIPQVVAAYDYMRPVLGDSEWMLLADWWTRYDPRGAYGWVLQDRDYRTPGVLRYVIGGMARTDREGALLTLLTLRGKEQRDDAWGEIVKSWYLVDQAGLVDHIVEMSPGIDRQRAISTLVGMKIRREGVEATRSWAEALDDDLPQRFKLQAFRRVANEIARVDPAEAMRFAERHAGSEAGSDLYRWVADRMAYSDAEAALDWLRGLPEGGARDEAVEHGYRRWVQVDREAALAWMQGAPRGRWLEPAFEVYALAEGVEEPERGLEMLEGLSDAERRDYAVARLLVSWYARAPEAAGAWLEASDLSPEMRERILARVRRDQERKQKAEERRLRMQEQKRQQAAREP